MAADGSVIIDVRLDKKSAIADLNALEAQIKRTTQKIGSIEKSLSSATTKRNNLRDDLEAARHKAGCQYRLFRCPIQMYGCYLSKAGPSRNRRGSQRSF